MLKRKDKEKIIKKFKVHDTDTGSPQVQIAILTEEISRLSEHLKTHIHDFSSRRGLMKKVGERRRLLRYLETTSEENFDELIKKLKIKMSKKNRDKEEILFKEPKIEEEETAETPVAEEE